MAEFTLLKLEVDDASFSANTPFGSSSDTDEQTDEEESGGVMPLVFGLVFLVAVAVVAKKFLGGDSSEETAVDFAEA